MARRRSKLNDLDRDKSDYALRTWAEHGYPEHKKGFSGQCPLEEDDPQDYQSYTYEYKTQKYLKKPGESADIKSKEYARKNKHLPPTRRPYSDIPHENEYKTENRYQHKNQKAGYSERDSYSTDPMLDHAATKIQAAFRGYQARKDFWKKREHHRRQNLLNAKQYRQDEYTIASVTSIVDDASISSLATNADPNLGLSSSLPYVDSSQRLNIAQKLKSTLSCFDDVSLVSQLRSERSPNIISLGGINPPQANDYVLGASMFVYNIQKDKWFFGGTMPEPRNYHTAAYLNGKIYVIGGYSPLEIVHNQMVATQSTYELSVRSKRWRKRADMHQARACHGMCVIDDNIVIFGGRDSAGKLLSTMEMYYPKRDEWRFLKSMPEAVMGLACAVLDGCIFAIGGIINEGHQSRYAVSDRVYAFGFEEQKWYKATSLPEPRAFASAATLNREIFLWGGLKDALNEDGYLLSTNSVLVYNNDLSKWEHHMTVGTMKHAAAIAKCGRRVYILGGMSNASNYKEVLMENDYYNRETDKYMEGASLPRPLAGSAAVAVPIDYIATSDPKWNSEKVNDDVMNEAATKIQATYRGYKVRSVISSNKFPAYSSSSGKMKRNDFFVMRASTAESRPDKWKFHRVQIENWPPPDPQTANTEIDLRIGNLPRGYTVTSTISGNKVKRYACLPPYVDPNLSMMGHLCSANKKAKKYVGLRKVECLRPFKLKYAEKLQHDCMPMILVMGGLQPKDPVNPNYGKLMLRYNILKNQWKYFSALPEPRNYHAAVYYKENIYVCGGCNPDKVKSGEMIATSTMYCLNIESGEWAEKAEMHCCRSHHNLVEYDGKICAIGGRDDNGRLVASIEYYEVEANKWIMGRPMDNPRMGMACAVKDDHIWCMGGIGVSEDLETYPVLSSVISYDINNKQWITRPPLRCPRAYGSCVVAGKNMWLVGGASKDSSHEVLVSMGSVDKYNEVEARWKRKTVMSNPRHSAAVVAIDTCIYVFGGVSSQEWCPLARNEMLVTDDVSLHQCEPLPVPLTGLAAVAVPPIVPSLRSESLAILLHTNLTYHD